MASINELEVKSVKFFPDHEGATIPYGNLYYKGKKVGEFRYDSWGGPMMYTHTSKVFSEDEVMAATLEIPDKYKWNSWYKNFDLLIEELVNFKSTESEFKKDQKKGNITLTFDWDKSLEPFKDDKPMIVYREFTIVQAITEAELIKFEQELKEKYGNDGVLKVYRSLDDFKI